MAISQTIAAIGFPVLITLLIPFRVYIMPMMFSAKELSIMDSLTADSKVVLESLGGKPTMRESFKERMEETKVGDRSDDTSDDIESQTRRRTRSSLP